MRRMESALPIASTAIPLACLLTFLLTGCGGGQSNAPEWALRLPEAASAGAWSPDGKLFAIPAHDRIELIEPDGDLRRSIPVPGVDNSGLSCECSLSWTEDGGELHIVTRPRPRARGGIATVGADGENLRQRYLNLHIADAAWAPPGWPLVLVPGKTVNKAGQSPPDSFPMLRLSGPEAGLGVVLSWSDEIFEPTFSPDGSKIAFVAGGRLWITSPHGGQPRPLAEELHEPYATWAPDGNELTLSAVPTEGDRARQLFVVSLKDGATRRLTDSAISEQPPAWTADGQRITYATSDGEVRTIPRGGGRSKRLLDLPGEEILALSWSSDGKHLAYAARPVPPAD